jgi:C4-dicarboxylate-specific signal transduction histidine kinase
VLNSVNVSTTLLTDLVRQSKITNVARLGDLLTEHHADLPNFFATDPRGQKVPGFVQMLSGHLAKEQRDLLAELESLRKNIEHIKEIVAMQQNYAKVSGVSETLVVTELVEDAVRMNATALNGHNVRFVRDFQAQPRVTVDKHKVLQILVNLMRNAKYACDDSPRGDKEMIVRVTAEAGRVKIAVIDNGVGIPPENLTRIFSHGFTTRKHGHGFGLHSGALAARELGGSLIAQSEGPGCGATFLLELPECAEAVAA